MGSPPPTVGRDCERPRPKKFGDNVTADHFVSAKVAKQIEERDPRRIIVAHGRDEKPPEPGSDEEFYAKFEVPDDLDW